MKVIRDIIYGDIAPEKQVLDIFLPETDTFSTFLYIHGGGIEAGDKVDGDFIAPYLTERGVAVVSINYRMYPSAAYPEFIRDAAQAVAWTFKHINEYGNCEDIYVGGSSAGGYMAMMLCFDPKWLAPYRLTPTDIKGYVHDAGQPTTHFNVLRERGIDPRRIIVDDAAPLYYIGTAEKYAPMMFLVSDQDIKNRYEQTKMLITTLEHFEYDMSNVYLEELQGTHCQHDFKNDANGDNIFATYIYKLIQHTKKAL